MGLLAPIPIALDNTTGLPSALGEYFNDTEGDCTCAAYYHARQVWSAASGKAIDSQPQQNAQHLYELTCGFDPNAALVDGQNPTDGGGIEQDVLTYLLKNGAPVGESGTERAKICAFIEIDPLSDADVNRAIYECGLVYMGIDVPAYLQGQLEPGGLWDVNPVADNTIIGGHALISAKYDSSTGRRGGISWGSAGYTMTRAFWRQRVRECYAIVDPEWQTSTGKTICGLTLEQTESQMAALKLAA